MMGFFSNIFGGSTKKEGLEKIVKGDSFLVDVRTTGEFAEGHVKGSANIPLAQLQDKLDKFKGKENIVVFCRSGMRSSQAKAILEQNGFTNVTNGGTWENIDAILKK